MLLVRFPDISAGWEQWVMLSSDRHHDSKWCDRELELKQLKEAAKRGALIVDAGDLFDVMQGKYDPRSSMDDIRPEDCAENYLDLIVRHAAEDYGEYAEHWLMLGKGNHETNVRRRHGTDLTSNLVFAMNSAFGATAHVGGYGGWVRFQFEIQKTKRQGINLRYYHGASTRAPVTRGVIQTNRQAVYLPDADVVLNGHNHESYHVPIRRERLSMHGRTSTDVIEFVRTPGYLQSWVKGEGFGVEKGAPKPAGCAWLRFWYESGAIEKSITLDVR